MQRLSKRMLRILGRLLSILLLLVMVRFSYRCYLSRAPQASSKLLAEVYQKGMYAADRPILSFPQKVFDFGIVAIGTSVEHTYTFANTGEKPLMIRQVVGGCCSDCLTTEWPRQPIQAGEQGEIKVRLTSTDYAGAHSYVIVVSANTDPTETRLLFKGVLSASNET